MSALNLSRVSVVTPPMRPLVVDLGQGHYAWIQHGHGFTLDTRGSAKWVPIVDAHGIGGRVLLADEIALLVSVHGRPAL